jgi:hypothetical protein
VPSPPFLSAQLLVGSSHFEAADEHDRANLISSASV